MRCVSNRMHLTVYHAQGTMSGAIPVRERTAVRVATCDTRLMLMKGGGEIAVEGAEAADHKIGLRVLKRNAATAEIQAFRGRIIEHETPELLGSRSPSTRNRSAFGARNFQPHMTVLERGNGASALPYPAGCAVSRRFTSPACGTS
jgi:hypothetical protein